MRAILCEKWMIALSFAVLLSACASEKGKSFVCPQVAAIRELERMEDYGRDTPVDQNLVSIARIKHIEGGCSYGEEGVDINFSVLMGADKGPRLGGQEIHLPYFISLLSPDGKILSKEIMTANFVFPEGQQVVDITEKLHVHIPLAKDEDGSFYRVLTGFQMTDQQLDSVRSSVKTP